MGPVQVLVVGYEQPAFTGEVLAELSRLSDAGLVQSVWSLADSVPAGTTAAVALIEHLWATPLREAILRTGGVPLDEVWLAEPDLQRLAASSD